MVPQIEHFFPWFRVRPGGAGTSHHHHARLHDSVGLVVTLPCYFRCDRHRSSLVNACVRILKWHFCHCHMSEIRNLLKFQIYKRSSILDIES